MNILVSNDLIKHQGSDYYLYDNCVVVISNNKLDFVLGDLNKTNADVYIIENSIDDFIGNKYMYINNEVILNPDWVPLEET